MPTLTRRAALAAALALTLAGAACASGDAGETGNAGDPAEEQVLTVAAPSDVSSWDPAVGAGATSLGYLQAVYSSLTTVNGDHSVGPGLATDWSYDEGRTTLTMTLQEDVVFSDGTALDADAVKANLDRGLDTPGSTQSALAAIAGVEVTGPTELVLTLSEPDPGLLYNLGMVPGMIANPAAFDTLATDPVGSGPYLLDAAASTSGSSYTFVRNPSYSLPVEFGFDKLVFKALPDTNAMLTAVTSGQVDTGGLPMSGLAGVEDAGLAYQEVSGLIMGMWMVDREGTLAPPLADVEVRQAINHGLDAEGILAAVNDGAGARTTQMFAAGTPAYVPELDTRYPYDPALARQLLADAGYPDGFTLTLPSENAYVPELYPIVAQQLAEIGIEVEYQPVSTNQITQQYLAGTFPAFMYTYTATQNWIDADLFLSADGVFNPFHVDDPTVSQLLGEIAVAADDQRVELFQELNRYVVEQAWFAPLYVSTNLLVWDPDRATVTLAEHQPYGFLRDYQPAG